MLSFSMTTKGLGIGFGLIGLFLLIIGTVGEWLSTPQPPLALLYCGFFFLAWGLFYFVVVLLVNGPLLRLNKEQFLLGEQINLTYHQNCWVPTRSVTVSLIFRESARVRRWRTTASYTDERVQLVWRDMRSSSWREEKTAVFSLLIPENGMHSLTVFRNSLEWFLRIHVDLPFLPDYIVEKPITVLPHNLFQQADPLRYIDFDLIGENNRFHAYPGEHIRCDFSYTPTEPVEYRTLSIHFSYFTYGKGSRYSREVLVVPFVSEPGELEANIKQQYQFSVQMPTEPWSYQGKYLSIEWQAKIVIDVPIAPDPNFVCRLLLQPYYE